MRALLSFALGAALAAAPAVPGGGFAQAEAPPAEPEPALPAVVRLQNEALAYAEAQAASLNGAYTFRVLSAPVLPRAADSARLKFERAHLSQRELSGHFFASFWASLDGRPVGMVRVDLEGKWNGRLLRSLDAIPRKSVPLESQFEQVELQGTPPAGGLAAIPAGYRLRAPISAGHVLVMQDLETIPVVLAGDQVRVAVVSGALTIAVDGLARSSGGVGDKVRVELPGQHRNLQALVTAPGEARIQWAGN
jgi:flagella basal body P-ring formation protein FlgA